MSRLKKLAEDVYDKEAEVDLEAADIALDEIAEAIDDLHDSLLKLFHGLNGLYKEYPKLYDSMKKVVKFPDERMAEDVSEMKVDFEDIRSHYNDDQYLADTLELHEEN